MPFNAQGQWLPENDDVASRVASISSSGSPLMQAAQGIGTRVANSRGLINSSIGTGAVTSSVLGAATPIASQEAQQTYGKNIQYMGDTNQAQMKAAEIGAQDRQVLAASVGQATGDYSTALANTLQNDKIPADARQSVQASMLAQYNARLLAIQKLYGVQLGWGA